MGTISTVRVTLLAAGVVVCGAAALVLLEPGITLIDAIYLTVATLTTVGYGDIRHVFPLLLSHLFVLAVGNRRGSPKRHCQVSLGPLIETLRSKRCC
eukprot:m.20486 g.20486  ORF g.20486 m.20486 type:complete len:97 (+) comp5575_c0_seq2:220-510(+)